MKRSRVICLAAIVLLGLACLLVITIVVVDRPDGLSEKAFGKFLKEEYEPRASEMCRRVTSALWNRETDLNNQHLQEVLLNTKLEETRFNTEMWRKVRTTSPENYNNKELKRQVKMFKVLGPAALGENSTMLEMTRDNMTRIFNSARVCPYENQSCDVAKEGLSLNPHLANIFAKSRNYDELVYFWRAWRVSTGAKIRSSYQIYVNLSNEAARANNLKDASELWLQQYESSSFVEDIEGLWRQIEPFYLELLEYVARKLKRRYGDKLDISDNLVPAHVFGDMWAQNWKNLDDLVKPFPGVSKIDVDAALVEKNFTILKMFKTADVFYKSMGLLGGERAFDTTQGAIIRRIDGRNMICHPSAWDFCDGKDFRIKICAQVNYEDFLVIHHELGHVQYYQQYSHQPYNFRSGANPGFHEAIGDAIVLSVSTPKHLQRLGLLQNHTKTYESSINTLMEMALQKIAFLPFNLLMDKWRWDIFSGRITQTSWNSHWWNYRKKYQRVKPPLQRSEDDFDPGAKLHVAADVPYISHFVAEILQFQIYKSLCIAAGEYDPGRKKTPLHECDFYGSIPAGHLLSKGLSLGASKHWREVLRVLTGGKAMSAGAILEYFEPLREFLVKENGL